MPRNPYIRDNQREQKLLEDLNVETIRSMGRDVYYIPRTLNDQDKILGEDSTSSFNSAYLIDMYHEDSQAFGGEGDIIGKFGIDVKDRASFRVARRTFMQEVTKRNSFIDRPREGDLIYYPLSGSLFEITFVEHENPLYQLGQLYSFVLFVETFAYNNEDFATGICDIDECFEAARKQRAQVLTLGEFTNIPGYTENYFKGEIVYQVDGASGTDEDAIIGNATATAEVIDWNPETLELTVGNIDGTFKPTDDGGIGIPKPQTIRGNSSNAERVLPAAGLEPIADADFFTQINTVTDELDGDNEEINLEIEKDDLVDFDDNNPFSEGSY